MSDFASLVDNLRDLMPEARREMPDTEWAEFAARLGALAPTLEQARTSQRARIIAYYKLRLACDDFPATRRVMAPPGPMRPEPRPEPQPNEPVTGLPEGDLGQRTLDIAIWLVTHPDEAASGQPGPEPRPGGDAPAEPTP